MSSSAENKPKIRRKTVFVAIVVGFIFALLALWLFVPSIRESKNLMVLFFYSFPSQFLISPVPHEPVFLYFSKFHTPLIVTLVAVSGTLITEFCNYTVLKYYTEFSAVKKIASSKFVNRLIELFQKLPFVALWIAGFTPIPFYPFRFLVVWGNYPKYKYLLAVFLSRTPRFFLLALIGRAFNIPDWILIALFVIMGIYVGISFIQNKQKKRTKRREDEK